MQFRNLKRECEWPFLVDYTLPAVEKERRSAIGLYRLQPVERLSITELIAIGPPESISPLSDSQARTCF
jgi:hypothetical protein